MIALPRLRILGCSVLLGLATINAEAKEPLEALRAKADKGEAVAQNELGCIYENG